MSLKILPIRRSTMSVLSLAIALTCAVLGVSTPAQAAPLHCLWPSFEGFLATHVQSDGRVIDYDPPVQTTSEGQSYTLFFALINNDRVTFDHVLNWTQSNLSGGDLTKRLPAWRWGANAQGQYGVLDVNSASDADLWLAYVLAQAGRLWNESRYTTLAHAMFRLIAQHEVFDLPGLGPMLAPGPEGFKLANDVWRLNPSYLPLPLLRYAARFDATGPWARIATNSIKLIQETSPHGFVPDWAAYQTGEAGHGFVVDPEKGDIGSYDAIRVYLWAGLTNPADPLAAPLLQAVRGMREWLAQSTALPERVSALKGTAVVSSANTKAQMVAAAPLGFTAALLPYLRASHAASAFSASMASLASASIDKTLAGNGTTVGPRLNYYNWVLALFGTAAIDGRFRFSEAGDLQPAWSARCVDVDDVLSAIVEKR